MVFCFVLVFRLRSINRHFSMNVSVRSSAAAAPSSSPPSLELVSDPSFLARGFGVPTIFISCGATCTDLGENQHIISSFVQNEQFQRHNCPGPNPPSCCHPRRLRLHFLWRLSQNLPSVYSTGQTHRPAQKYQPGLLCWFRHRQHCRLRTAARTGPTVKSGPV